MGTSWGRGGRGRGALAALAVLLGAGPAWAEAVPAPVVAESPAGGGRRSVAIWVHPSDVTRSAVLAAEGDAGLAVYALDGGLLQRAVQGGTVTDVDVALAPPAAFGATSLVLAVDSAREELVLLTVDPASLALTPLPGSPLSSDGGVRLAALQTRQDAGEAFIFATDALSGTVRQWALSRGAQGQVGASQVREFGVQVATGFGLEDLLVDDSAEQLYTTDGFQVLRMSASADAGPTATAVVVDSVASGRIFLPTGLGLLTTRDGGYLLVADSSRDSVVLYDRASPNLPQLKELKVRPPDGGTAPLPVDRVAVQAFALGEALDAGLLVTSGARGDVATLALVPWGEVAAAFTPPLRTDPEADPRGARDAGGTPDGGPDGGGSADHGTGGGGSIPTPQPTGCGCTGGGGAAAVGLAVLLLGLVRRRTA